MESFRGWYPGCMRRKSAIERLLLGVLEADFEGKKLPVDILQDNGRIYGNLGITFP